MLSFLFSFFWALFFLLLSPIYEVDDLETRVGIGG